MSLPFFFCDVAIAFYKILSFSSLELSAYLSVASTLLYTSIYCTFHLKDGLITKASGASYGVYAGCAKQNSLF